MTCRAETQSEYIPSALWQDRWAGRSVAIASTGVAAGSADLYRWMATGAPGDENNEVVGFVNVSYASVTDGLLDPSYTYNKYIVPQAPYTTTARQFGWAVIAANMRSCHAGGAPGRYDGCGTELLISAPDTFVHGSAGRLFWWEPDGDDNGRWQSGGTVAAPGGLATSAEFGYALAAAWEAPDASIPWEVGEATTRWVAVGAPGADRVFIYSVDPTSATPLTKRQELVSPYTSRRFGDSLAVGDFDHDGIWDLAVGAPQENGADRVGRVFVFRGVSNSSWPFLHSTGHELDGLNIVGGTDHNFEIAGFGNSVAAGHFVGSTARDALLVGAPYVGAYDHGGYCQYVLAAETVSPWFSTESFDCVQNSFTSATSSALPEHLGWSVAVGGFQNEDSTGLEGTEEADLDEIAVARPGYTSGVLTKAVSTATCTGLDGYFDVEDADGITRSLRVFNDATTGTLALVFAEDYAVQWLDSSSNECSATVPLVGSVPLAGVIPAGTRVDLSPDWDCTWTTHDWVDSDLSELVKAITGNQLDMTMANTITITQSGAGDISFAITLDDVGLLETTLSLFSADPSCRPEPLSGTGVLVTAGVCE